MTEESKSRRRSREEWGEILKEYEKRSCTQGEFCERRGIRAAALKYHLDREVAKASFIPVIGREVVGGVTVEFPSGIRLTIKE
jgi:hypothetical protein